MNLEALSELGKIAGIAGIAIGAMVIIFNSLIRNTIFKGLSAEHSYRIIRLIVLFAGVMAIAGLGSWVYLDVVQQEREHNAQLHALYIRGEVVNDSGEPIAMANVQVEQDPAFFDKSDQNGKFALELRGKGRRYFDLILSHGKYLSARQKILVDFEEGKEEVNLSGPVLLQSKPIEVVSEAKERDAEKKPEVKSTASGNAKQGSIYLKYMGDLMGCNLDLYFDIGGITLRPVGNDRRYSGIPLGSQSYSVSGNIHCAGVYYCAASGSGSIELSEGGEYYVVWNTNNCQVQLYEREDYLRLNGL